MRISSSDRAVLRQLLEQIPTDPDFDGFCLDYFPDTHRRFSSDMERVAKINLLLQLVPDRALIAAKLRERFPTLPEPVSSPRARVWLIAVLAGGAVIGLVGYLVKEMGAPSAVAPAGVRSAGVRSAGVRSATNASADAGRGPVPDAAAGVPSPVGTVVDHAGDIQAKGSVKIGAPSGGAQTVVKTRGQIQAGGDVQIGVTAPATPARRKDPR